MKRSEMEIGKIYVVNRPSNDGSVQIDDLVAISANGKLFKGLSRDGSVSGWIDPEELTEEILSFEVSDLV